MWQRSRKSAKQVKISTRYCDGFKFTAVSNNTCDNVHECVMAARAI